MAAGKTDEGRLRAFEMKLLPSNAYIGHGAGKPKKRKTKEEVDR